MGTIGRNDPCPCGSGKKYKACCLDRDAALQRGEDGLVDQTAVVDPPLDARDRAVAGLTEFAVTVYRRMAEQGRNMYLRLDDFNESDEGDDDGEAQGLLTEEEETEWSARMMLAVMFDLPIGANGEVVAEAYLRKKASRLADDEKAWIHRVLEAPLTPYEILEVTLDTGTLVRSLTTNEQLFIPDPEGLLAAEPGEVFAARLTNTGTQVELELGSYWFEAEDKAAIEAEIAKYVKESGAPAWSDLDRAQRRLFSVVIHALWTELMLEDEDALPAF